MKAARRLIFETVGRQRRAFVISLVAAFLYLAALLAIPIVGKRAVDDAILGGRVEDIIWYVFVLFGLGLMRAIFGGIRKYQAGKMMAAAGNDVRDRIFQHLQRLSFSYHDRLGTGQLMSRASSDVTLMEAAVAMIPFLAQSVLLAVGGVVILFVLQPALAAAVFAVVVVLSALTVSQARPIHRVSVRMQEEVGVFAQFVEQRVGGIRVVKGHGLEAVHGSQGADLAGRVHEHGVKVAALRGRFLGTFIAIPGAAMLVVIGFGGWLALGGRMTPGGLFAFMQYLGALVAPVLIGAQALVIWPQSMASSARIAEVLVARPDLTSPQHPMTLPPGPGTVRFEGVNFGYEPRGPVLRDFSLEIPGGSSVALVGMTGCGKSTVARLIPRFYDPWEGRVLLDGAPVIELSVRELRRKVSIVFEDTVIFSGTVRENITIGRPHATDAEVLRAAELAQADGFIRELPYGYDTVVGEQAATLSGGQRQRLAIARAILRDPRVLILDDATSAVDPATDEAIRRGLQEVMRGRTTIIVAHRVETLALADRVVLMERGRIVEQGAHQDLLRIPVYRRALGLDTTEHRLVT